MTEDLRERLDAAFQAVMPAPAPVDEAVRRGKRIRLRRRAVGAAGVAAAVAAAVLVPLGVHSHASPAPATRPGHYTVTVRPPGPHDPAGVIATGTINGKSWQFAVSRPGTGGLGHDYQFLMASGPGFGPAQKDSSPVLSSDGSDPATFEVLGGQGTILQVAAVGGNVTRLTVSLTNGTQLTLYPVTAFGVRAVAFGVPAAAVITDVTAYSRAGEIATAVPYTFANGVPPFATFVTWLKPGQHGLARGDGTFAVKVGGKESPMIVHTGPWGICVDATRGGTCLGAAPPLRNRVLSSIMLGSDQVLLGSASAAVVRIVAIQDGHTITTRPQSIAGQLFFALATGKDMHLLDWIAYDAAGHVVASGQY
jgi:hypothetical protein